MPAKHLLILVIALFFANNVFSQTESQANKQAIQMFQKFYNANKPDSIFKHFSAEMKAALPADKFTATTVQLNAQLGKLLSTEFISYEQPLAIYKATFEKAVFLLNIALNEQDEFMGLLLKPYQATQPDNQTSIIDNSLTETPYSVKTLSGNIAGSLVRPKNSTEKVPVVLIIAGSGPTDRNGNGGADLNTNTYAMLANELGKKGIATLRYDKRMVGESKTSIKESDLKFDDMIEDAIGLLNDLNDKKEFSKIIVAGHSEGSLVGMIAAHDAPADGFISIAGAGEQAFKIITEQLKDKPKYVSDGFKKILDSLNKGKFTPNVDPTLFAIARPEIQGYLLSWFKFDPAKELKKLKIPILIIQGTTDLQVSVAQAEKLKKAESHAQLLIIPGMNHVLKEAPADRKANQATYNNPDLPLKPELVTAIVNFVKEIK